MRDIRYILLLLLGALSAAGAFGVQKWECAFLSDPKATAIVLIPDTEMPEGGYPAVVLLHDHGAHFSIGKEKMISPMPAYSEAAIYRCAGAKADSKAWVDKYYDGAYVGDSLAAAGYVVIAIDAEYWGARAMSQPDWEQILGETLVDTTKGHTILQAPTLRSYNKTLRDYQPRYYDRTSHQFRTWFDRILADDQATVSFLIDTSPIINPNRVACFGFSMGAYRAWQLAAADKRIAVCVASNWMTTFEANGGPLPNQSSWSMYRPKAYPKDDYPVVASRIAPRPFLLMYGIGDPLFPESAVLEADSVIRAAYHKAGAAEQYRLEAYPVRHFFSHEQLEALIAFLNEYL